ncbi:MAG: hypothetical protein ACMXYG_04450 [Candidatus Woesearchaeota archaeon]
MADSLKPRNIEREIDEVIELLDYKPWYKRIVNNKFLSNRYFIGFVSLFSAIGIGFYVVSSKFNSHVDYEYDIVAVTNILADDSAMNEESDLTVQDLSVEDYVSKISFGSRVVPEINNIGVMQHDDDKTIIDVDSSSASLPTSLFDSSSVSSDLDELIVNYNSIISNTNNLVRLAQLHDLRVRLTDNLNYSDDDRYDNLVNSILSSYNSFLSSIDFLDSVVIANISETQDIDAILMNYYNYANSLSFSEESIADDFFDNNLSFPGQNYFLLFDRIDSELDGLLVSDVIGDDVHSSVNSLVDILGDKRQELYRNILSYFSNRLGLLPELDFESLQDGRNILSKVEILDNQFVAFKNYQNSKGVLLR